MSRVQCIECGTAVVVDPTGICPEGHLVTGAGARVARAVGVATPHPDEPEPWVGRVELEVPTTAPIAVPRTIRPMMITDTETDSHDTAEPDTEALMRELHALGDLDDLEAAAADPGMAFAVAASPPTTASATSPPMPASATERGAGRPTPPPPPPLGTAAEPRATPEEVADGFAELSALESAFQALASDVGLEQDATPALDPAAPAPPPAPVADEPPAPWAGAVAEPAPSPTAGPAPSVDTRGDLADVELLFASVTDHQPETPDATPAAAARRPETPEAAPEGSLEDLAAVAALFADRPGPTVPAVRPPTGGDVPATPPQGPAPGPRALHVVPELPSQPPTQRSAPAAAPEPAPEPVAQSVPEPEPAPEPVAKRTPDTPLDITNFTARGTKVGAGRGGGRRKLFGR